WTETGQYERILTSVTGCDSTVTTNLVVEKVNGKGKNNSSSTDKISPSEGNSESTSTTDPDNQGVAKGKSSVVSAIEFNAFQSYEEFIIYPNPAKSYINIDYSVLPNMNTKVEILNGNGQVVYNQTVESSLNRIDINHLSPGMYYIRSISDNRANIKKLIVE
ncbi:MAG: T9SS type A sorting domain-containing protein, partial [Prolixibacteraceae bacterium]|nr:T9SS type A sorting domain-containing protein [Prolixibacteraceae bacterium]